jgi:hypothetical protein
VRRNTSACNTSSKDDVKRPSTYIGLITNRKQSETLKFTPINPFFTYQSRAFSPGFIVVLFDDGNIIRFYFLRVKRENKRRNVCRHSSSEARAFRAVKVIGRGTPQLPHHYSTRISLPYCQVWIPTVSPNRYLLGRNNATF